MPVVVVSGPVEVVETDPRSGSQVTDPEVLASLHGVYSQETCADYLNDPILEELSPEGGRLRLAYDSDEGTMRVRTTYQVARKPTDEEESALVEETVAQWSDGIGSGYFGSHRCEVLSTTLAMALQNNGHSNLGDLFVDVYPTADDDGVRTEYLGSGAPDDELIADLVSDVDGGDANAMVELGRRYQTGNGIPGDAKKAFELFASGAEQQHPFAVVLLGLCRQRGEGCEQDHEKAVECFKAGVALEFPLAMHCLGEVLEKDNPDESVALYQRGVELGDVGCLAALGECYEFGRGVSLDLEAALECYQRCIDLGFDAVSDAIERIESSTNR